MVRGWGVLRWGGYFAEISDIPIVSFQGRASRLTKGRHPRRRASPDVSVTFVWYEEEVLGKQNLVCTERSHLHSKWIVSVTPKWTEQFLRPLASGYVSLTTSSEFGYVTFRSIKRTIAFYFCWSNSAMPIPACCISLTHKLNYIANIANRYEEKWSGWLGSPQ